MESLLDITESDIILPGSNLLISAALVCCARYVQPSIAAMPDITIASVAIMILVFFFTINMAYIFAVPFNTPDLSPLVIFIVISQFPLPSSDTGMSKPSHEDDDGLCAMLLVRITVFWPFVNDNSQAPDAIVWLIVVRMVKMLSTTAL